MNHFAKTLTGALALVLFQASPLPAFAMDDQGGEIINVHSCPPGSMYYMGGCSQLEPILGGGGGDGGSSVGGEADPYKGGGGGGGAGPRVPISTRRHNCLTSGGSWDEYKRNGQQYYECLWVYDHFYLYAVMNRRGQIIKNCEGIKGSNKPETCS